MNKDKQIKKLLHYMDVKHKIRNVYSYEETISRGVLTEYSTNENKMLVLFFNIVLSYHYDRNLVPIVEYHDDSTDDKLRISLLTAIFPDISENMGINLYDKVDLMYVIIYKILIKIKEGFKDAKNCEGIAFTANTVLPPNIDVLFYIVFFNTFSFELRHSLRYELRILSNMEDKILQRCSGHFLDSDSHICKTIDEDVNKINQKLKCKQKGFLANISIKSNNNKFVKMNELFGILTLVKIFGDLRPFQKRRPSKR
jgi:hypothetical protein